MDADIFLIVIKKQSQGSPVNPKFETVFCSVLYFTLNESLKRSLRQNDVRVAIIVTSVGSRYMHILNNNIKKKGKKNCHHCFNFLFYDLDVK